MYCQKILWKFINLIISQLELNEEEILGTLDVLQEVVKGFGYSYRDYQRLVSKMQVDKEIDLASTSTNDVKDRYTSIR